MSETAASSTLTCPVPLSGYDQIVMGHGSGGRLSADLLRQCFLPAFANPVLDALEDQASLQMAAAGWRSPRIPLSCGRFFFRAVISGGWRSTAR